MNIEKETFVRWIENLIDADAAVCLRWFGDGKTFPETYEYLLKSWSRDEVATAFMMV